MRVVACVTLLCLYAGQPRAQDQPVLELDDLSAPDVPALAVLGTAPAEIQRPASARAVATTLLNNAVRSQGGLVSDFAVEFAPYWWVSHPQLTFEAFNGSYDETTGRWHDGPDLPQVFAQSLSFSLGASRIETELPDSAPDGTSDDVLAGFGVSFDVLRGRPSPRQLELRRGISLLAADYSERELLLQARLQNRFGENPEIVCTDGSDSPLCRAWREGLRELQDEVRTQQLIRAEIEKFASEQRVGHRLEFSAAVAYRLVEGSASDRELGRTSAWLTYAYTGVARDGAASPLQLLALVRWNRNESALLGPETSSYDLGGRLIWEPRGDRVPLKASLEYLTRVSNTDETDGDDRLVAQIDYEINEEMSVFVSFGRNFESNLAPGLSDQDVVAVVGINLAGGGPYTSVLRR